MLSRDFQTALHSAFANPWLFNQPKSRKNGKTVVGGSSLNPVANTSLYPLPPRSMGQQHAPRAGTAPAAGQAPPAFSFLWIFQDPPYLLHACLPYSSSPRATTNTVSGNTSEQGRVCWLRRSCRRCQCCSARSSRSRPRRRWPSTATQEAAAAPLRSPRPQWGSATMPRRPVAGSGQGRSPVAQQKGLRELGSLPPPWASGEAPVKVGRVEELRDDAERGALPEAVPGTAWQGTRPRGEPP